jgi:hypothetical protein
MRVKTEHQLLKAALRVLGSWVEYRSPAPEDLEMLRESLGESGRDLPVDLLANQVIERELARGRSKGAGAE